MEKLDIKTASKKDIAKKVNELVEWANLQAQYEINQLKREFNQMTVGKFMTDEEYTDWLKGQIK